MDAFVKIKPLYRSPRQVRALLKANQQLAWRHRVRRELGIDCGYEAFKGNHQDPTARYQSLRSTEPPYPPLTPSSR